MSALSKERIVEQPVSMNDSQNKDLQLRDPEDDAVVADN